MASTSTTKLIVDILVGSDQLTNKVKGISKLLQDSFNIPSIYSPKKLPFERMFDRLPSKLDLLQGINSEISNLSSNMKSIQELGRLSALGFNVDKLTVDLKKLTNQMGITETQFNRFFKQGIKNAKQFDFSMLTLLFTGMALQRVFGTFNRNLINTYKTATDNTNTLTAATNRVNASWEFLKFSIMDALNTDFFVGMIDGLTNFINWLAHAPTWVKASVAISSIIISGLATGMIYWAQAKMATILFGSAARRTTEKAAELAGESFGSKILRGIKAKVSNQSLLTNVTIAAGVTLAVVSFKSLFDAIKGKDYAGIIGYGIAGLLGVGGAISAYFLGAGVGIALTILGSVLFLITKFKTQIVTKLTKRKIIDNFLKGVGITDLKNLEYSEKIDLTAKLSRENILLREESISAIKEAIANKELDIDVGYKKIRQLQEEIENYYQIGVVAKDSFSKELETYRELESLMDSKIEKQREINRLKKEEIQLTEQLNSKKQLEANGWVFSSSVSSEDLAKISSVTLTD